MAAKRASHGASDHRVPTSASAKKAIGKAEIGRASDCKNARTSSVKASAIIQSPATMTTPVVDQGNKNASKTASKSTFKIRAAGSCRADRTAETTEISAFPLSDSAILNL